ncbi:MAG: Helix-turn-helix domain [Solirubrobacteraceae bacterium]
MSLARALLDELDDDDLAELALRLGPFLPRPAVPAPDGWLSSREAATHLGISRSYLRKLTAARAIPFHQDAPGGPCKFKRSALDRWREER